jgi:transketolase
LGIGICTAAGIAYAAKYIDKEDFRTYCLCGDGECAEGSVWEAMDFAGYYKLDNLVNIIDINRLGQSQETMYQHDVEHFKLKCESFGWNTIEVDGHCVKEIVNAFEAARQFKGKPTCILAKTVKGKYFPGVEDVVSFHGKPLGDLAEPALKAVKRLIKTNYTKLAFEFLPIQAPSFTVSPVDITNIKLSRPPNYKIGEAVKIIQKI